MADLPAGLTENTNGTTSLRGLAELIGQPVGRLLPMLDLGYLRVVIPTQDREMTIVARPNPAAMDWLKQMFLPLPMRLGVTIKELLLLSRLGSLTELREICVSYNIPIRLDPFFGEILTLEHLPKFLQCMYGFRDPARFDRISILEFYLSAGDDEQREAWRRPSYSQRLENEIKRISRLAEPERTLRATDFLQAFMEGKTVAVCVQRGKGKSEEVVRVEAEVRKLKRNIMRAKAT